LEKLKEDIAQSVKKAGMEAELDSSDKAIKVNLLYFIIIVNFL
jgi:hypothetical protein